VRVQVLATTPLAVLGKLPETLGLTDGLAAIVRQLAARLERDERTARHPRALNPIRLVRMGKQIAQGVNATNRLVER
jgi:hypothetical protein